LWFGGRGGRLGIKGARAVIRPGLFSPVALLTPGPGDCWGRGVEVPIKKAWARGSHALVGCTPPIGMNLP